MRTFRSQLSARPLFDLCPLDFLNGDVSLLTSYRVVPSAHAATQRPRTYSHGCTRVPSVPRTCSRPSESTHARSAANHIHARASPEDHAQAFILMAQTRCGEYICICYILDIHSLCARNDASGRWASAEALIMRASSRAHLSIAFCTLWSLLLTFLARLQLKLLWQLVELQLTVLYWYLYHSGAW